MAQGIINKVSVQYIDKNRAELKNKYKTFEKFRKGFEIDITILEKLKQLAEKERIVCDQKQY
ncbi:peptidase S41, partial [bacterium]|nr:peptidase S41 [bacterium]